MRIKLRMQNTARTEEVGLQLWREGAHVPCARVPMLCGGVSGGEVRWGRVRRAGHHSTQEKDWCVTSDVFPLWRITHNSPQMGVRTNTHRAKAAKATEAGRREQTRYGWVRYELA